MTPDNWSRIKVAFQSALELDPEERARFLNRFRTDEPDVYREINSLLEHHYDSDGFLEERADLGLRFPEEDLNPWVDRNIGPYRTIAKIGEGGMGAVYRAIRVDDHYLKNVAIKLVRSGFATRPYLRRFKSERQILASLDHPNIAHLLDGGATEEGLPYLVMEFIEGHPIDQYCDRHVLPIAERLRLFLLICSAVQYAHQNLVVHRDLKPANILVTHDGTPKLLDFGIAKLLDPELYFQTIDADGTMARAMSPEYASPEQVRGDPITTASDVYSLGVVLYRLLTGHPPYVLSRAKPMEWARTIVEEEPERPSVIVERAVETTDSDDQVVTLTPDNISTQRGTRLPALRRSLKGDLDNILLKALRKDPARRYTSVEQFAEDIRRAVGGLPVLARPDTLLYRSGKFVRRHKIPFAAAILILLSLSVGIILAVRQARIAERERARAERRFNDVRRLSHDLIFDVHDSIQYLAGATPARKLIVQDALQYLNSLSNESAGSDISLQQELATAYDKVGDSQGGIGRSNLGDTPGALESYSKALDIRKAILAETPQDAKAREDLASSYIRIGTILQDMGRYGEALQYLQSHLELSKDLSEPSNLRTQASLASAYDSMGDLLVELNQLDKCLDNYRNSAAILESLAARDPSHQIYRRNLALEHKKIGGVFEEIRKMPEALQEYRYALRVDRELAERNPQDATAQRDLAVDYSSVGDVLSKINDQVGALRQYRQALVIDERLTAADPKDASSQYYLVYDSYRLGDALLKTGDVGAAIATYQKAAKRAEVNSTSDPQNVLMHSELARVYAKLAAAHMAIATKTSSSRVARQKNLFAARNFYQMSLNSWLDLRKRGALQGRDLHAPDEVAEEISKCDQALQRSS